MNKKVIALLSSVVLTAGMLVGCGSKGMKDGTYKSEFDSFDDHGWKGQVEITVADGKITNAKFDSVNEAGELKSKDANYQATMTNASGIGPVEFSAQYAKALVEKQDPESFDAITGATYSGTEFKTLAKAAIQCANSGKTETALVKPSK